MHGYEGFLCIFRRFRNGGAASCDFIIVSDSCQKVSLQKRKLNENKNWT